MWMTIEETASYLKVSKETVYKLAQQGKIPGSKLGNQWRFKRELVDSFLEAHTHCPTETNQSNPAPEISSED